MEESGQCPEQAGLDAQVTMTYAFIGAGPYAELQISSYKVHFKQAAIRNIVGMSPTTALVIQALKALSKGGGPMT